MRDVKSLLDLDTTCVLLSEINVEVVGVEPTCNQLRFRHGISVSRYTSYVLGAGLEPRIY